MWAYVGSRKTRFRKNKLLDGLNRLENPARTCTSSNLPCGHVAMWQHNFCVAAKVRLSLFFLCVGLLLSHVSHALFFREEKKNTQHTRKETSAKKKKRKPHKAFTKKKVRSLLSLDRSSKLLQANDSFRDSLCLGKISHYTGAGILTSFPFAPDRKQLEKSFRSHMPKHTKAKANFQQEFYDHFKAVSAMCLGLTHPRRTKLQHGTFLRFGHPRLKFSVRLLATSTKICTVGSFTLSREKCF